MVCTSLHTERYTTKQINESDYKEHGRKTSISRIICFHERCQYSSVWSFQLGRQEDINVPI